MFEETFFELAGIPIEDNDEVRSICLKCEYVWVVVLFVIV